MAHQLPCPGVAVSINFHEVQIVSDGVCERDWLKLSSSGPIWRRRTPRPSDIQISNRHFLITTPLSKTVCPLACKYIKLFWIV
ncbi:hypothetical protein CEXT_813541 [Caerostris extrusa]|uniref:Uncharacterized protein n=1 Tax=Caerostris extrusa TaxID=172846 RepID=A0AAV4MDL1_CAEEX|nr:hypothetical protein CEXT_813541 [Caerostris extrusa]